MHVHMYLWLHMQAHATAGAVQEAAHVLGAIVAVVSGRVPPASATPAAPRLSRWRRRGKADTGNSGGAEAGAKAAVQSAPAGSTAAPGQNATPTAGEGQGQKSGPARAGAGSKGSEWEEAGAQALTVSGRT